MSRRVVVTGIGIISAIGANVDETLDSIHSLKSGIGKLSLFESVHNDIPVAEVKVSNDQLLDLAGITSDKKYYSRTALLGIIAARQALSGIENSELKGSRSGLISATTVGGMDLNEHYYQSLLKEDTYKEYLSVFDSADSAEKIARCFGINHHVSTISTACSSSANSVMLGARLIRNNQVDRILVGGTDSLTKFTLNGFFALEILSPTGCHPFDKDRNGLTIGEGAAYLLLEAEEVAEKSKILCELSGYANTNEAFHQTASSSDGFGAVLAMRKALKTGNLEPADINYINAHGTGTLVNDLSEGRAIETVFAPGIPLYSSTKSFTGHTLGAAGAIEAVLSVLAIKHQLAFPNLGFENAMEELFSKPHTTITNESIHHVMSNSFGFGGSNSSLIFSKI
jgi:3-oxoacyl-(acyl-carrier-protein) synthase